MGLSPCCRAQQLLRVPDVAWNLTQQKLVDEPRPEGIVPWVQAFPLGLVAPLQRTVRQGLTGVGGRLATCEHGL